MSEVRKSWVKVAAFDTLEENIPKAVKLDDTPLILLRISDGVRAFAGKCPHKGAPMEKGVVCALHNSTHALVCPWHKAVFSVENGRRIAPLALDPLERYEAMVRGGDVYVSVKPKALPQPTPMRQHEHVAIAGAGAAALAACVTLRESGFEGRITMISPEERKPYDRTALSKSTLAAAPEDIEIPPLRDENWYTEHRVDLMHDKIVRFDYETRTLELKKGDAITAEHVLLATGSAAKQLDIPGIGFEGVYTLRSAADALAIAGQLGDKVAAVIIGSGFIGMEAAAALRKRGVGVTVVSRTEFPFEKQFGPDIASSLRRLHEDHGTAFIPKRHVVKIRGKGRVDWVELDDGTRLTASVVLVGAGAEPELHYIDGLPRNPRNGGLDVDHHMSLGNDVFAAGDIASVPFGEKRYRIEHWRTAQSQGQIAARAMLGLPVEELTTPYFWTQQYDQKLEWVGWPGEDYDHIEIDGDVDNFKFIARLEKKGKLVGVIGSKHPKEMGCIAVRFDEA